MTLDKEEHRAILLEILDRCQFAGVVRKMISELGDAIEKAEVKAPYDTALGHGVASGELPKETAA